MSKINKSNKLQIVGNPIDYLALTQSLLRNAEIIEADPMDKYITWQSGKNRTYCVPSEVFIDFKFFELKKNFAEFIVEYRSGKRYYEIKCTLK